MKKEIYLFLIMMVSIYTINVSAQNRPVTFGIKAGLNLSNASTKVDDQSSYGLNGKDSKVGFQVGMTVDFEVSKTFFFQSGLSFTTKGVVFKDEDSMSGDPVTRRYKDSKANLLYLQLPIMGAYKINMSPNSRLVISAGPYLAYGIGGKIKFDSTFSPSGSYRPDDDSMDSFGDKAFKKFDFGLGTGIGFEYKSYCLNLGYEWGLSNINRDAYNSDIVLLFHRGYKNRNASLTLGYKF